MPESSEMPKAYDPHSVEERLYDWWESRGFFQPPIDPNQKPFVISIPPPNVTGELHHGHAMFLALEDLMIRWHRMRGEPTLWVPGSDHAGIATQNVVERSLEKQGISKGQLGREEFVKRVWEWKEEYGGIITHQIRRMGASCDWTRERFTLDEGLSRAVRQAFVTLYEKGLIYRGPRLINWCPRDQSAISDLEVEHEEQAGKLYYVRYPLESLPGPGGQREYLMVATTRPETILGDTAIAVHPEDKRYKALVGRTAMVPVLGRRIPIIADDAVDPEFGTGAVKVTPGHDPTDYDIGERHHLAIINIMNKDATLNENAGPYAGLDRFVGRDRLVEDLQQQGLLDHVEDHLMSIGRCQRCDAIVEPLISTQWFVKIAPLAKPAIDVVKKRKIKIIPTRFEKVYFEWMQHIRDWCISRQLWWGHRIPVWYCENGHHTCATTDPTQCAVCGSTNIHQDEDVLDTWFSSGLWPFSTLGWPDKTADLKYFYPTTVLETGYDILFFWVARMIMMGLEFTGKVPFYDVYLHGLIRHKDGSKISKSNPQPGDNPLDVIADYSADALRFTIVTSSAPGNDTRLDMEKVEHARNFGNKIWNMGRFIVGNLNSGTLPEISGLQPHRGASQPRGGASQSPSLADRWILSRLNHVIADVNKNYEGWEFGEGTRLIHEFLWSEFADWYIEASKVPLYSGDEGAKQRTRAILVHAFDRALRLLHPTMPFVTEETWQHLRKAVPDRLEPKALIVAPWPTADRKRFDLRAERDFGTVMDIVRAIRNARTEFNVEPGKRIPAIIAAGASQRLLEEQRDLIASLARLDLSAFQVEKHAARPAQALALIVGKTEIYLPLAGMIDVEKEKVRLSNEIAKVKNDISRAENMLAGEFSKRAPAEVVQRTRDQLAANRERMAKLDAQLASLDGRAVDAQPPVEAAKPRKTPARKAVKRTTKKRTTAKRTMGKRTNAKRTGREATRKTVKRMAKKTTAKRAQKQR